jgi:hypothetical protein
MKERRSPKPFELPGPLREFLRTQERACVLQYSPRGTLVVLKTNADALATLQPHSVIRASHELHSRPTAPVIRSAFQWYDRPDSILRFEAFTDVADSHQRADFRRLAGQAHFTLLGYTERLELAVQRRIDNHHARDMGKIADFADRLRDLIPPGEYDFGAARARVEKGVEA